MMNGGDYSGGGVHHRGRAATQVTGGGFTDADMRRKPGHGRSIGLCTRLARRARAFLSPEKTVFEGVDEHRVLRRNFVLLVWAVGLCAAAGVVYWLFWPGPAPEDALVPRDYTPFPRRLVHWSDAFTASGPAVNITSGLASKELQGIDADVWYSTRDAFAAMVTTAWLHDLVVMTATQVGVPLSLWVVRIPPDVVVDGAREVELSAHDVQRMLRRVVPDTDDEPDVSLATGVPHVHLASPEVVGPAADGSAEAHGHVHIKRLGESGPAPTPTPQSEAEHDAEAHSAAAATRYLLLMNVECVPYASTMGFLVSTQTGEVESTLCPGYTWEQTFPHDVECTAQSYHDDTTQFGFHPVTFRAPGEVAGSLAFAQEETYVRPHTSLCFEVSETHGCTTRDARCSVVGTK